MLAHVIICVIIVLYKPLLIAVEQCPNNNFYIKLSTGAHFVRSANLFDVVMTYIVISYTKDMMRCINKTIRNDIIENK